jgi:hypothetical protein
MTCCVLDFHGLMSIWVLHHWCQGGCLAACHMLVTPVSLPHARALPALAASVLTLPPGECCGWLSGNLGVACCTCEAFLWDCAGTRSEHCGVPLWQLHAHAGCVGDARVESAVPARTAGGTSVFWGCQWVLVGAPSLNPACTDIWPGCYNASTEHVPLTCPRYWATLC